MFLLTFFFFKEIRFSKHGLGYNFSNNIVLQVLLQVKNAANTKLWKEAYIIPQEMKKVVRPKTKFLLAV